MSDGVTFGVRLEASSNVAEVAKGDSSELERLKAATDALAASSGKMANQYSGLDAAVKQHSAAVTETAGNVNKLLDRYDPLGAKLRQLQADFKALDAAAAGGKIAGRDDARVDLVYQKIQQEIGAATSAAQSFGNVAAGKSDEVAWATARARQEFMVLGREIASGNYSRIPSTLSIIAQGLSPVALGVAAVTAAVAAGAYAWSEWGDAAGAAADKALGSLYEAQEEARKSKHLTDSDRREQLREQIATNQAQIKELDLEIARKIAIEQQPMGSRRTAGERESIEVGIAALRNSQDAHRATIENLKKSEQELTEKITPSSIAIAKQTSELWKNYEIKEKLAKLTGGAKPDAPSDAAIIADAAGGLRDKLNPGKPFKPYAYPELTSYLKGIRAEEEKLKKEQWKEHEDWQKEEERKAKALEEAERGLYDRRAEVAGEAAKKIADAQQKEAERASKSWENFTGNVQRNLGDVLYNGLQGKFEGIGDMFKNMLMRMAADAAAAQLTQSLFGTARGGGWLGSAISWFGDSSPGGLAGMDQSMPIMASARGNIFSGAGIAEYSSRIVDRPTLFPFARGIGLMGEAGPEAIMPLRRDSSGRLGVSGGGGTTIHITSAPVINIDSRSDRADIMRMVGNAVQHGNAMLVDQLQRSGQLA